MERVLGPLFILRSLLKQRIDVEVAKTNTSFWLLRFQILICVVPQFVAVIRHDLSCVFLLSPSFFLSDLGRVDSEGEVSLDSLESLLSFNCFFFLSFLALSEVSGSWIEADGRVEVRPYLWICPQDSSLSRSGLCARWCERVDFFGGPVYQSFVHRNSVVGSFWPQLSPLLLLAPHCCPG